jgi:hypothetical protein
LFTDKNQSGRAPGAQVSDVTYRWNRTKAGAGFQIAAAKDDPPLSPSGLGVWNLSLHDSLSLVDSVLYRQSAGIGMQLTRSDENAKMDAIRIDRLTVPAVQNSMFIFGSKPAGSLTISNSLFNTGKYGSTTTGSPLNDCSKNMNTRADLALTACWTSVTLFNNWLTGSAGKWPSGFQTTSPVPVTQGVDQTVLDGILKGVQ